MADYPEYIRSMQRGCTALKRVVVADGERAEPEDATTCCILTLSEDLEQVSFENADGAFELSVSEISRVLVFDEEEKKELGDSEWVVGLLVPADRLVVALEFACEADFHHWVYGLQVLTTRVEEEVHGKEAEDVEELGEYAHESFEEDDSIEEEEELVYHDESLAQGASQASSPSGSCVDREAQRLEAMAEENSRLRAALALRDDTVRDLLNLVELLVDRQLKSGEQLLETGYSRKSQLEEKNNYSTLGA